MWMDVVSFSSLVSFMTMVHDVIGMPQNRMVGHNARHTSHTEGAHITQHSMQNNRQMQRKRDEKPNERD